MNKCLVARSWMQKRMRKGITEAIKLKIKYLIIEGDNLCVINALKGAWKYTWKEDILISDSCLDLRSFRTVEIRHVFADFSWPLNNY